MPICLDSGFPIAMPGTSCPPGTYELPNTGPGSQAAGILNAHCPAGYTADPSQTFCYNPTQATQAAGQAASQAAGSVASQAGQYLKLNLPESLTNSTTWKRVGLVAAGVLVVLFGFILVIAKPAEKVSTTAGKVVA